MVSLLWTQRQDIGPSGRYGHALAYDAGRSRTLLVGGDTVGTLLNDTWLWDGETWTQVEDIGPSGRAGHAVANDTARQRVVLFGGRNATVQSDTWEWDGTAWTQVADTGPAARSGHALAYDSARSRVVLFGGEDAALAPFGDTWEWDGDEWTQVADTGPSPRAGHSMCFDSVGARTILFGGSGGSDTWSWDGTVWTELNEVGPAPCDGTRLVFTGQSTILFGGIDDTTAPPTLYRQTWELIGSDWTQRQDMGPAHRFSHGMAYDSARARVVLFGGGAVAPLTITAADVLKDTWELPTGNGAPGPGPGPDGEPMVNLVAFTIVPDLVSPGESFTITVEVDQPAPAPTGVTIAIDGMEIGSMVVDAQATSSAAAVAVDDLGLPGGPHEFTATLGANVLTATLTIQ